jgi:hypothetical protein
MPKKTREAAVLPPTELDSYDQCGARFGVSGRTIRRLVAGGMPIIKIPGLPPRIDPVVARLYIRGELPPPEPPPVRRGRPPGRRAPR